MIRFVTLAHWLLTLAVSLIVILPPAFGLFPMKDREQKIRRGLSQVGFAYASPAMLAGALLDLPFRPKPRFTPQLDLVDPIEYRRRVDLFDKAQRSFMAIVTLVVCWPIPFLCSKSVGIRFPQLGAAVDKYTRLHMLGILVAFGLIVWNWSALTKSKPSLTIGRTPTTLMA